MNQILSSVLGAGLLAASALTGALGFHTVASTSTTTANHGDRRGVFIASSTDAATIACVGAAVTVRENALQADVATHEGALTAAYTARGSALETAYQHTSPHDVKAGVKTAWTNFISATFAAKTAWTAAKATEWKNFVTAVHACKASPDLTDTAHMGSESN